MAPTGNLNSTEPGKFTFRWTIMNLHMFGDLQGEEIASPKFIVPSLHQTEWCVKLKFVRQKHKFVRQKDKFVNCFLHRLDNGPENIEINYSLTVGPFYSLDLETFDKNVSSTQSISINIHELGQNLNVEQGPMEEVLIECHLWPRANEFNQSESGSYTLNAVLCLARTLIPYERRNFYIHVNNHMFNSRVQQFIMKCMSIDSAGGGNTKFG